MEESIQEEQKIVRPEEIVYNRLSESGRAFLTGLLSELTEESLDETEELIPLFGQVLNQIPGSSDIADFYPIYAQDKESELVLDNLEGMHVRDRIIRVYTGQHYFENINGERVPISDYSALQLSFLSEYDFLILQLVSRHLTSIGVNQDQDEDELEHISAKDVDSTLIVDLCRDILRVSGSLEGHPELMTGRDVILQMSPLIRSFLFDESEPYQRYEPDPPVESDRDKLELFRLKGATLYPDDMYELSGVSRAIVSPMGRVVERIVRDQISGKFDSELNGFIVILQRYMDALDNMDRRNDGSYIFDRDLFESYEGRNSFLIEHTANILTWTYIAMLEDRDFYQKFLKPVEGPDEIDSAEIRDFFESRGLDHERIKRNALLLYDEIGRDKFHAIFGVLRQFMPPQVYSGKPSIETLEQHADQLHRRLMDPFDPAHNHLKKVMYGFLTFARMASHPIKPVIGMNILEGIPHHATIWGDELMISGNTNRLPDMVIAQTPENHRFQTEESTELPMIEFDNQPLWRFIMAGSRLIIVEIKYRTDIKASRGRMRAQDFDQVRTYADAVRDFSNSLRVKPPEDIAFVLGIVTVGETRFYHLEHDENIRLTGRRRYVPSLREL